MIIETPAIEQIPLSKIKYDKSNPNVMTDDQLKGLKKVFTTFKRNVAPIIVNAKYKIIDGEHRVKVYHQLEQDTIPGFVIDLKDATDEKMLRQVMNKLRGEHDFIKDANDFKSILAANKLGNLASFLAQPKQSLIEIIESNFKNIDPDQRPQDSNPLEQKMESFLHGNIKQVVLFFNNKEYEAIFPRMQKIMKQMKIDNHTDLFVRLVKHYENTASK